MHTTHPSRRRGRDDRGVTLVFFAIGIVALLTVGALVLGSGVGYTAVRNAQTAADAAALAGTSVLREHKRDWIATPADVVLNEVISVVEDNGGTLAPGGCDLLAAEYAVDRSDANVIADCSQLGFLEDADFQRLAGVRVRVLDERGVPFGEFVEQETITGNAVASATAQPVTEGRAPFMVCTSPNADGHPAQALLPDADGDGYSVNPDAVGKLYVLQGNQMKYGGRDCKDVAGDSDWRGLVRWDLPFSVPSSVGDDDDWWQTTSGNSNGTLPITIAGGDACQLTNESLQSLDIGCRLVLPLCPDSNDSTDDYRLFCVELGAFEITHIGTMMAAEPDQPEYDTPCGVVTTNIICGRFLGAANATGGQGRAETPDTNGLAIIKLVE